MFQKAHEEGRACKCYIECGWQDSICAYEVYPEAGGTNKAKEHNETIIEAIREEMRGEEGTPTLIMGDFSCEPNSMKNVQEMIQEESWIDVGHCADWWGGEADQLTCHQRAKA